MDEIIAAVREIQDDSSVPKAVKQKLEDVIAILEAPGDSRLKINKVLCELEELSYNTTLPSFIRTQLWNVTSMLESA